MPGERLTSDPKFRTESLFYSVEGLKQMIEAIRHNKVDLPPTFIGFTNVDMAKIAMRFGFKVVDSCLDNNSDIDISKPKIILVGNLEIIREKLEKFIKSDLYRKVKKRYFKEISKK